MKKIVLISELHRLAEKSNESGIEDDPHQLELIHVKADDLLLEYINDAQIRESFEAIVKGYA